MFVAFSALHASTARAFVHARRSPTPVSGRRAANFPWGLSPLGPRLLRGSGFCARTVSRETGPCGWLMFHVKRSIEGEFDTVRGTAEGGLGGPFAVPCPAVFHVKRVGRRARVSRETGIVPPRKSPNVAREPRHDHAPPSHPPPAAHRSLVFVAGHRARCDARSWRVDGRGGVDDGTTSDDDGSRRRCARQESGGVRGQASTCRPGGGRAAGCVWRRGSIPVQRRCSGERRGGDDASSAGWGGHSLRWCMARGLREPLSSRDGCWWRNRRQRGPSSPDPT